MHHCIMHRYGEQKACVGQVCEMTTWGECTLHHRCLKAALASLAEVLLPGACFCGNLLLSSN